MHALLQSSGRLCVVEYCAAAWGMVSFPGPLLARRPEYIDVHGSKRLRRLDLHALSTHIHVFDLHMIIMFSAEWHCPVFCLERMI